MFGFACLESYYMYFTLSKGSVLFLRAMQVDKYSSKMTELLYVPLDVPQLIIHAVDGYPCTCLGTFPRA